jgi:hypothetical protein
MMGAPSNASTITKSILFIAAVIVAFSALTSLAGWIPLATFTYAAGVGTFVGTVGILYHTIFDHTGPAVQTAGLTLLL